MEIIRKIGRAREQCRRYRDAGERIVLVPTMGALHEGHLSLIRKAREIADRIVVSIFVNPLQFGPEEDYQRYPKPVAVDVEVCDREGVDLVFHPEVADLYPDGFSTFVGVEKVTENLCGKQRPDHFRGVATVVLKLINIFQPEFAVFGQKDFQQSVVIRRLVRDLNLPTEVVVCPIVRESDGLAVSSRNRYLSSEERRAAAVIFRALSRAETLAREGEKSARRIEEEIRAVLESEPIVKGEYIALTDAVDLQPTKRLKGKVLVALAARVGTTRLIDNVILDI